MDERPRQAGEQDDDPSVRHPTGMAQTAAAKATSIAAVQAHVAASGSSLAKGRTSGRKVGG